MNKDEALKVAGSYMDRIGEKRNPGMAVRGCPPTVRLAGVHILPRKGDGFRVRLSVTAGLGSPSELVDVDEWESFSEAR